MSNTRQSYLDVTQNQGRDFLMQQLKGEIIMLNLLRFNKEADYSTSPELAPSKPISGKEAYDLYMRNTSPLLEKLGGKVLFFGNSNQFLIGPNDEQWDVVMLVQHKSVDVFMAFASDETYLKGVGHRTAALADSRLLPTQTPEATSS